MLIVHIVSCSHALPFIDLPGLCIDNQQMVDALTEGAAALGLDVPLPDPNFARDRVGVLQRYWLDRAYETEDLAWAAVAKLPIDRECLRVVVVSTVTHTQVVPSLSSMLHRRMQLGPDVVCLDAALGCHGFVAGLKLVERLLQGMPEGSQGVLVAAELMSRRVDAFDRGTSVIFGDGAGAVLVERSSEGLGPVQWSTQGEKGDNIIFAIRPNPYRFWVSEGQLSFRRDEECPHYLVMEGRKVFRDMVTTLPQRVLEELHRREQSISDFDWAFFHQANSRIVDQVAERLGLPPERVVNNIDRIGNTSSASIPIVLSELHQQGRLKRGDRLLMVGFGAGYSVAVASLTW